jgi:hypothetical protein
MQFTFAGSRDLQGTGAQAVISATADENSFVFMGFQNEIAESVRRFVDAKISGVNPVNERNALLSQFARYTDYIGQLHYTITGSDGNLLEVYGDRLRINHVDRGYAAMMSVNYPTEGSLNFYFSFVTPPPPSDSPTELFLRRNLQRLFRGQTAQPQPAGSLGELEFWHGLSCEYISFDVSQSDAVNAIMNFLVNTIGLGSMAKSRRAPASCLSYILMAFVGYILWTLFRVFIK